MTKVSLTIQQVLTLSECRDVRSQLFSIRRQLSRLGDTLGDMTIHLLDDETTAAARELCDLVTKTESELFKASDTFRQLQEKASKGT